MQDKILWSVLSDKCCGYFVDCGAYNGEQFSNTLAYERIGWTGICIEAHPMLIPELRIKRPKSIVVHAAAGPQNVGEVTFYITQGGFLSTADKNAIPLLSSRYGYTAGYKETKVPMMTLDTILDNAGAKSPIDLVCIDVEGYEVEVLKGFTLHKWWPRILLVEGHTPDHHQAVGDYMLGRLYHYAGVMGVDLAFCRDGRDAYKLRAACQEHKSTRA